MKRCVKSSYDFDDEIPEYEVEIGNLVRGNNTFGEPDWVEDEESASIFMDFEDKDSAISFAKEEFNKLKSGDPLYVSVLEVYDEAVWVVESFTNVD